MFQSWVNPTPKCDRALANYLKKNLSIKFKNIALYKLALRHKSVVHNTGLQSNERLEFLGDSIIDTVVSDSLYIHFPTASEGKLTKIRSKIVSRKSLTEIAQSLGIQNWLELEKGISEGAHALFGNALEAIVGAIYRDRGYKAAEKFIKQKILEDNIDFNLLENTGHDYKSKLLEWTQKNRHNIYFTHIENPFNNGNRFTAFVHVNNIKQAEGNGGSKKSAEQQACENVFEKIADGGAF